MMKMFRNWKWIQLNFTLKFTSVFGAWSTINGACALEGERSTSMRLKNDRGPLSATGATSASRTVDVGCFDPLETAGCTVDWPPPEPTMDWSKFTAISSAEADVGRLVELGCVAAPLEAWFEISRWTRSIFATVFGNSIAGILNNAEELPESTASLAIGAAAAIAPNPRKDLSKLAKTVAGSGSTMTPFFHGNDTGAGIFGSDLAGDTEEDGLDEGGGSIKEPKLKDTPDCCGFSVFSSDGATRRTSFCKITKKYNSFTGINGRKNCKIFPFCLLGQSINQWNNQSIN